MSETVVPTTSQLEALKRHIATTKALKIKRLGEFTETKLLIIQVLSGRFLFHCFPHILLG